MELRGEWQRLIAMQRSTVGGDPTAFGSGWSAEGGTFEDGSARGTGGRNSGRGPGPAGADAGRVSVFSWETIAGKSLLERE